MTTRFPAEWVPPDAAQQAGVFRREQAMAAGMTAAQVRRRRQTGQWTTVVGAALAHSSQPIAPWQLLHGAWLTWPDSVLCLSSAARLYRLPVAVDARVHVHVPHPRAARGGLTPHEFKLPLDDVVLHGRARATSLSRTLFDCIGRLDERESERLVIWAITRELMTRDDLERAVSRRRRLWGNTRRRRALTDTESGAMGPAERRLHAILSSAGITGWLPDEKVYDNRGLIGRADVLFPEIRLVIEIDGEAYHGADTFQSDRTRQNRLVNAGCTVLRFTWRDLTERPGEVLHQIQAAIRRLKAAVSREI